ncbi:hypothetical protein F5B21DRAFT_522197 [Xylaria acuta]|nr:hypothetical protein F5B21DRAFT_522197 [Xylaria acuta]
MLCSMQDTGARRFRLSSPLPSVPAWGRRDLFVAVGGRTVTDIVGFVAAAIYHRPTRCISISTNFISIVLGSAAACHGNNELSLHHTSRVGAKVHRDALTLSHPPIATPHDPASPIRPPRGQARRFWAELVRIAVVLGQDSNLFLHVETHIESMPGGSPQRTGSTSTPSNRHRSGLRGFGKAVAIPVGGLGGEAVRAIRLIKGNMTASSLSWSG